MLSNVTRAVGAAGIFLLSVFATVPALAQDDQGDGNQVEFTGTVTAAPPSGTTGAWTIGGKTVNVDASTEIDQENGALAVGATVKVEGTTLADGSVQASRIEVLTGAGGSPPPGGGDDQGEDDGGVDFTGAIEALPPSGLIGTWTVAGKQVQVVSTTSLDQEEGGFAIGTIVEVQGQTGAGGVIVASQIEVKGGGTQAPQPPPEEFELQGTIEALPLSGLIGN